MSQNKINAKIINAAVSNNENTVSLYYGDQSHALPSIYTKQDNCIEVKSIPLDKIIMYEGEKYGIKIDIEGSEALLTDYYNLLRVHFL